MSTPAPLTIDALLAALPPCGFPPQLAKIRMVAADPRAQLPVVAAMLSEDPVLTFAVLGRANCGDDSERADPRPSAALTRLGFAGLVGLIDECEPIPPELAPAAAHCWEAGMATADFVRLLLPHVAPEVLGDRRDPEIATTAGLLSEIGTLLCLWVLASPYAQAMRLLQAGEGPFPDLVQRTLGMTPHRLGSHWARHWGLPALHVSVLRYQHHPLACPDEAPLTALVHVARCLARCWGCIAGADAFLEALAPEVLELLGLRGTDLLRAIKAFAASRRDPDWFEGSPLATLRL